MSWLLALLVAFVAMIGGACAEDRALIIGINKYPHFPTKQLTGAVNDARAIERLALDVWKFKPTQIKLLLDEQATSTSIIEGIENWLIAGTAPGDRVLLYYSGHGYYVIDRSLPAEEAMRETIAPSDARRVGPDIVNMIVDLDIKSRLDQLTDRTVMFIADACHSGTLWRNVGDMAPDKPSIVRSLAHDAAEQPVLRGATPAAFDASHAKKRFTTPNENLIAWSSVQATELAEEDMELAAEKRHGVFTRRFIEGLRDRRADRNGDGVISPMELYAYVSEAAARYCVERLCRSQRMTPMMEAPNRLLGLDLLAWRSRTANSAGSLALPVASRRLDPANLLPAANVIGLKLELLPGPNVRLGQEIGLRLTSPKAGWLVVLDVRDDGKVVQLFPSKCARPDRRVGAGAILTLPDGSYGCAFAASEPGSGQILAILSEDNMSVEELLASSRDLEVVIDPDAYLAELARRLMGVWSGDEASRPTRWSLVSAHYRVAP